MKADPSFVFTGQSKQIHSWVDSQMAYDFLGRYLLSDWPKLLRFSFLSGFYNLLVSAVSLYRICIQL